MVLAIRSNYLNVGLLELIDPALLGMKEKLAALVPRYVAEVSRYDGRIENTKQRQMPFQKEKVLF